MLIKPDLAWYWVVVFFNLCPTEHQLNIGKWEFQIISVSEDIESCRLPAKFLVHSLSCSFSFCTFIVYIQNFTFQDELCSAGVYYKYILGHTTSALLSLFFDIMHSSTGYTTTNQLLSSCGLMWQQGQKKPFESFDKTIRQTNRDLSHLKELLNQPATRRITLQTLIS